MIDDRYLMPTANRPPCVMTRGRGSYLWDETGKRYLDFVQGWAVNALGHCPEQLVSAVKAQLDQLITPSPAYHTRPQLELARRLSAASGLERVTFVTSGAEANETAVKLARKWGRLRKAGAHRIITTHYAFHGRTLAMMAASGKPGWDELFPPPMPGFVKVPFADTGAVERAIDEHTIGVLVEPIQGEAGVVVPHPEYLRELRELTERRGLLLLLDEIQTGMGRTGRLFAKDHFGVQPDILTLGKGLGCGLPLAAVLSSEQVSCFTPGDHGGTHAGNPLLMSAGLASLQALDAPALLAGVRELGARLRAGLEQLRERFDLREARGVGLLQALVLAKPLAARVRDRAFQLGLLVNAAQPHVLRLMPSLQVSAGEIDQALQMLAAALAD